MSGISGIRLIDILETATPREVNEFLRQLPEDKVSYELIQRNSKGVPPLHFAIEKADLEMTKLFLSFDAPISERVGDKTAEDYSKELVVKQPNEKRKRVYALIKSRGKWQINAHKGQVRLFSRCALLIESALDKIQAASQKSGVLFLGVTGEGKSTLINYLCGIDYHLAKTRVKKVESLNPEIVRTGSLPTSETIFPEVVPVLGESYVFVDLPGFEDTRSLAERICAAASTCMLSKKLNHIQAIPLVCSLSSFDTKMLPYRNAAQHMGAIISKNPETAENVILVVTKGGQSEDDLVEEVREKLQQLMVTEGWIGIADKHVMQDDPLWGKKCIRKTTEAILSRQDSIVIADVTTPQARDVLKNELNKLQKKARAAELFDFENDSLLKEFRDILQLFFYHYIEIRERHENSVGTLTQKIGAISEKQKEISQLEKEKTELENELKPFDLNPFQENISKIQVQLDQLKSNLATKANLQKRSEEEQKQFQSQLLLAEVAADPAITSARSRAQNAFNEALRALGVAGFLDNAKLDELRNLAAQLRQNAQGAQLASLRNEFPREVEGSIAAHSTFSSQLAQTITTRSTAIECCKAFVSSASTIHNGSVAVFNNAARAGSAARNAIDVYFRAATTGNEASIQFTESNISINQAILRRYPFVFNASEIQRENAAARVGQDNIRSNIQSGSIKIVDSNRTIDAAINAFNTAAQTLTEAEVRKAKASQEIRNNLQILSKSLQDCQGEIWNIVDQIKKQEVLLMGVHQRLKDSQAIYDTQKKLHLAQVADITRNISRLEKTVSALLIEQEKETEDISFSKLEIEVNQDLFAKIREIVVILDLRGQEIDRFLHLSSTNI